MKEPRNGLGINDVRAFEPHGSSVTGKGTKTGHPFGDDSDIDFYIVSDQLVSGLKMNRSGMVYANDIKVRYPALRAWANRWSNKLKRQRRDGAPGITIVGFGSGKGDLDTGKAPEPNWACLRDVYPPDDLQLSTASEQISKLIGAYDTEQRYSDNFPGGTYLVSCAGSWSAEVSKYDHQDEEAGGFSLLIYPLPDDGPFSPEFSHVTQRVLDKLSGAGWRIESR